MTVLPFAYRTNIFADFGYVSADGVESNLVRCVLRRVFTAILGCDYREDAAYESGGYQSCEADPFHYSVTSDTVAAVPFMGRLFDNRSPI
jgi:hypothetical protein